MLAFAVVVIGGLGSMPGAALGALIVGLVRSAAVHLLPEVELFVIYAVMALVLAFRPRGLFVARGGAQDMNARPRSDAARPRRPRSSACSALGAVAAGMGALPR